jgi:hypothetical protein
MRSNPSLSASSLCRKGEDPEVQGFDKFAGSDFDRRFDWRSGQERMDARSNLSLSLTANRSPRYFGNAQKAVRDEFIVSVSSKRPHTIRRTRTC